MPRKVILSDGRPAIEYLPGERVPDHVEGEIGRFTVPYAPSSQQGTADSVHVHALEDEGLDDPQRVAADDANETELEDRMAEAEAGFANAGSGVLDFMADHNLSIAWTLGGVAVFGVIQGWWDII